MKAKNSKWYDWPSFAPMLEYLETKCFKPLSKIYFPIHSHFFIIIFTIDPSCQSSFFLFNLLIIFRRIAFQSFSNHIECLLFLFLMFRICKYFSLICSSDCLNLHEWFALFPPGFLIYLLLLCFLLWLLLSIFS